MKKYEYYNALPILSYNAIFNFIISNRNYGKTWAFKKRAFVRGIKKGKKTLWIRRFRKEVDKAKEKMFSSSDLQKFCGIIPYDPKTKTGNFKQEGTRFYCKYKGKWIWFLELFTAGDSNAIRSADDVDCDTIVYDEFTTTPEKYRMYRGNEVEHIIDSFISTKREHKLTIFFLGNKESVTNPYFNYFGIKPLPFKYEGIRTYRNGSIAIQQINNKPKTNNDYDSKLESLLAGTSYGNYLYEDAFKNAVKIKRAKAPIDSSNYIQMNFNGNELRIMVNSGMYYVSNTIDKTKLIYTSTILNKYNKEALLVKRHRPFFHSLEQALVDGRVYYENEIAYECILPFYQWLGI